MIAIPGQPDSSRWAVEVSPLKSVDVLRGPDKRAIYLKARVVEKGRLLRNRHRIFTAEAGGVSGCRIKDAAVGRLDNSRNQIDLDGCGAHAAKERAPPNHHTVISLAVHGRYDRVVPHRDCASGRDRRFHLLRP